MKLPFIQFYPADYLRDTRALSCAAKGGWVDILCMLHGAQNRGTMTLPLLGWARIMSTTVDQAKVIIEELEVMQTADIERDSNGNVTVTNRRMCKDDITREQNRLRVQKYRRNKACNGAGNENVTDKKTETRNQKTETIIKDISAAPSLEGLADDAAETALMVFPCVGKQPTWGLTQRFVDELRKLYPTIDPLTECDLARSKIANGAVTKKTAKGMPKFLFSWMDRASNQTRGNSAQSAKPARRMGFA